CWVRMFTAEQGPFGLADLFRAAVGPDFVPSDAQVRAWLEAGPPVLLFCDLDDTRHVSRAARLALAERLGQLQGDPDWAGRGPRCVAASGAAGAAQLDEAGRSLGDGQTFVRYPLGEFSCRTVVDSLCTLWDVERRLAGTDPSPADRAALERRLAELGEFIAT